MQKAGELKPGLKLCRAEGITLSTHAGAEYLVANLAKIVDPASVSEPIASDIALRPRRPDG